MTSILSQLGLLHMPRHAAPSWVKKVACGWGRKLQFSDRQMHIFDRGAQNFNSAPKFPPNVGFSAPHFALWTKIFRQ